MRYLRFSTALFIASAGLASYAAAGDKTKDDKSCETACEVPEDKGSKGCCGSEKKLEKKAEEKKS